MATRNITLTVLLIALITFLLNGVDGLPLHSSLKRMSAASRAHTHNRAEHAAPPSTHHSNVNGYATCTVISYSDDNCITYPQSILTHLPFTCDPTTNTFLSVTGNAWTISTFQNPNCTDHNSDFSGTIGQCSEGTNVLCSGSGPSPPLPTTINTLTLYNVECGKQFWQASFISGQCLQGPGGDAPFQSWIVKIDSTTSVFTAQFFGNFNCSESPSVTDESRGNMCMTNTLNINYQIQAPISSSCTVTTYVNTKCTNSAPLNTYAATPTVCVPGTVYTVATNKLLVDSTTQNWTIQYFNTNDTTCAGPVVATETGSANGCDEGGNRKVQCTSFEQIQLA